MNLQHVQKVMEMYSKIVSMRSVEYFSNENLSHFPSSWQNFLTTCSQEDVVKIINNEHYHEQVIPLSLWCLKSVLVELNHSRNPISTPQDLLSEWIDSNDQRLHEPSTSFNSISSDGILRKKIKAKKQHEIDRIVELIEQVKHNLKDIDSLVDIGAGVGHLSRVIAIYNKLNVLAVEGNDQFTLAANNLDQELLVQSQKTFQDINFNTSPVRFTSFVTENLAEKVDNFTTKNSVLVGLHTCGDFSSTILRVFTKSRKATALVLLGCCYHKEYQCFNFYKSGTNDCENEEVPNVSGVFPLSRKWEGFELSYIAREMACHNNENLENTHGKTPNIARYARAHLEKWITEISDNAEDRNIGMCPVKCEIGKTTFEEYIRKAMLKRGSHLLDLVIKKISDSNPSLLVTNVSDLPREYFDVTDTMRLIFAPLIESCIIDDRIAYLRENGFVASSVPLFDPKISPRNIAIVAYKR